MTNIKLERYSCSLTPSQWSQISETYGQEKSLFDIAYERNTSPDILNSFDSEEKAKLILSKFKSTVSKKGVFGGVLIKLVAYCLEIEDTDAGTREFIPAEEEAPTF